MRRAGFGGCGNADATAKIQDASSVSVAAMPRPALIRALALALLLAAVALALFWAGDTAPETAGTAPETASTAEPSKAMPSGTEAQRVVATSEPQRIVAETTRAEVEAGQGVRGRVVDDGGMPLPLVHVALLDSVSNDPIGKFLARAQDIPELALSACRTGDDGSFALGLRTPTDRKLQLCLFAEGYAAEAFGDVAVATAQWVEIGDIALVRGCTITGRVTVAGTDLPAPGAVVTLASGNPFLDHGPSHVEGWAERRTAAVGPDGRYEIRHAPQKGMFRLVASAPGFGRQIRDEVGLEGRTTVEEDFALPRGLSIRGHVDAGTKPLGHVKITAFPKAAEPPFPGEVASDGSFVVHGLRDGMHLLQVEAEGFQPVARDDVAAGASDLRIELTPRGRAGVRVLDSRGTLLRSYRLSVRRWFAANGGQIAIVRDAPDRVVRLDPPNEACVVDGLEDGEFVFQVEAPGHVATLSDPVRIDTTTRHAETTMQLHRGGTILGTVVDEQGRPVVGARILAQPDGATEDNPVFRLLQAMTPDRVTRAEATSAADGSFVLQPLAHAAYQVAIDHESHCRSVRRGIRIEEDRTETTGPIRLVRGCEVFGRAVVVGDSSQQIQVVLTPQWTDPATGQPKSAASGETTDETSVMRVEAVTKPDGRFVLPRRIPPGVYEVRGVSLAGSDPGADAFQKILQMKKSAVPLEIRPGQESAEVEIRIER